VPVVDGGAELLGCAAAAVSSSIVGKALIFVWFSTAEQCTMSRVCPTG